MADTVQELMRCALESYREEYQELSDRWRNLDAKAQGVGAIAGVFLAAAFAWARDVPVGFGCCERLLLAVGVLLLVGVVLSAVLALRLRSVSGVPTGLEIAKMVEDIRGVIVTSEAEQRILAFCQDQTRLWKQANDDMRLMMPAKARWVQWGQWLLFVATVAFGVLSIIVVLRPLVS